MKKPKIKVLFLNKNYQNYLTWLEKDFEVEKLLITNKEELNKNLTKIIEIDLVVFTGGADVNPKYYVENKGKYTSINKERDEFEFRVLDLLKNSIPKLGICRGAQLLTVYSGNTLIQHVAGHTSEHEIEFFNGYVDKITSTHHQMMYPNNSNNLLLAWSNHFRSNTYLNGNNEEIKLPISFLEPEIVYYPSTNSLCIQGHPEFETCSKTTSNYCLKMVNNLLNKELIKKYENEQI